MSIPQLEWGVASIRSGVLADQRNASSSSDQLQNLAATLPEIFGTLDPGCLERIGTTLGVEPSGEGLAEVLLLSENYLHVIQPFGSADNALLAVSPASSSIGLVLSQVHTRGAALEKENE